MRAVVLAAFPGFTANLEGALNFLYLDKLGIPTTAYGNALFSTAAMCALPWRHADGTFASRDEMIAEYSTIQNLKGKTSPKGVLWTECGGGAFGPMTRLHLDSEGITTLVQRTIQMDDAAMARKFPDWEEWPANAQLAIHSLVWACGTGYRFPKMDAALRARDFGAAAREIEMTPESNPGNDLTRRNAANQTLMTNAARVQSFHLDYDMLNWANVIAGDTDDEPTLPGLPDDAA